MNKDRILSGRVTIPTDVDVVPETIELLNRWERMPSVIVMVPIIQKN